MQTDKSRQETAAIEAEIHQRLRDDGVDDPSKPPDDRARRLIASLVRFIAEQVAKAR